MKLPGITIVAISMPEPHTIVVDKSFIPCLREEASAALFVSIVHDTSEEFTENLMEAWDLTDGPFGNSCVVVDGTWTIIVTWVPDHDTEESTSSRIDFGQLGPDND